MTLVTGHVAEHAAGGYQYDLFVSYRRNGNVGNWVQNHFAPVLDRCLADELPHEPRMFLDVAQDVGTHWPDNITRALHRSRLLLAVWSPSYFTSRWCLAEWRTMLLREQVLGIGGPENPMGLVCPIRFSDGERFPVDARNVVQEMSFKDWRLPYPQFVQSERYLDFHQAVIGLAERLAERFDEAPEWQADWPVERPEPPAPPAAMMPRL